MLLQANAKLNWTLDVLGRRADGYHLLDTLMSPISLCDDIEITLSPDISIICENMDLPCDEHNTAYRAVKAYYGLAGMEGGASVRITKRIPPLSGLGGGSADAAAVLRGLNALHGALDSFGMLKAALSVGADVPFCLMNSTGRCRGIGEKITVFPSGGPLHLLLVMGGAGVSTAALFRSLKMDKLLHPDTDSAEAALRTGDPSALAPHLKNALLPPAAENVPQIQEILERLRKAGALGASMTGSGACCFGLFPTEEEAVRAAPAFSDLPFSAVCRS